MDTQQKKGAIMKTLAIFGLVGIIGGLAWLSIQLVQGMPSAFSSLASLAESVGEYQESVIETEAEILPLTVTADTSWFDTGNDVTLKWNEINSTGSYTFSYTCTDGVSVLHTSAVGERMIQCDTAYNIGSANSLTISVESEKKRYTDVAYTIAFVEAEDDTARASGGGIVTVVNQSVITSLAQASATNAVASNSGTDTNTTEPIPPVTFTEPEPTPTTPATPVPELPAIPESTNTEEPATAIQENSSPNTPPSPTYTLVMEIPQSDPAGNTDLGILFSNAGHITNNNFVRGPAPDGTIDAVQFSIKNYGTKTSETWSYGISLPTGGTKTAGAQAPLKPNERATLTVGFNPTTNIDHTFVGVVSEDTDTNANNDQFQEQMRAT